MVPVQSAIVTVVLLLAATAMILSVTICVSAVELLCCLLRPSPEIAVITSDIAPRMPTASTTIAIIISMRVTPSCSLAEDLHFSRRLSSMRFHSTLRSSIFHFGSQLWQPNRRCHWASRP